MHIFYSIELIQSKYYELNFWKIVFKFANISKSINKIWFIKIKFYYFEYIINYYNNNDNVIII